MLDLTELALAERLEKQIRGYRLENQTKYNYYYGKLAVKDLGISTPPRIRGLNQALGWGTSAVDVVEERIFFRGFYSPDENATDSIERLNTLYRENDLETLQRIITKDSLIAGTSYISIGAGDEEAGEPAVLYRPESPDSMTGDFNFRTLRLDNAMKIVYRAETIEGTLYLPDRTIQIMRGKKSGSKWLEVSRDEHNLGFVPVVTVINEQDSRYPRGRTEITRALRGHIDSAMRILLGTETAREFFAMPLRTIVGANPDDMVDSDGNPLKAWDMLSSKILGVPYNEDAGIAPTFSQLPASNPENIMNLLEPMARLAAREIGVPPSFFGFETVNPSSADAINEADKKLIHKANKRIPTQARAYKQAFRLGQLIENGEVMEGWDKVQPLFMRPETPTPSAASDRIIKLKTAGLFDTPLPDFIYREAGFTEIEIMQLKNFLKNKQSTDLITGLLSANQSTGATATGA